MYETKPNLKYINPEMGNLCYLLPWAHTTHHCTLPSIRVTNPRGWPIPICYTIHNFNKSINVAGLFF